MEGNKYEHRMLLLPLVIRQYNQNGKEQACTSELTPSLLLFSRKTTEVPFRHQVTDKPSDKPSKCCDETSFFNTNSHEGDEVPYLPPNKLCDQISTWQQETSKVQSTCHPHSIGKSISHRTLQGEQSVAQLQPSKPAEEQSISQSITRNFRSACQPASSKLCEQSSSAWPPKTRNLRSRSAFQMQPCISSVEESASRQHPNTQQVQKSVLLTNKFCSTGSGASPKEKEIGCTEFLRMDFDSQLSTATKLAQVYREAVTMVPDDPQFCYCERNMKEIKMVRCCNNICPWEWFHYPCVMLVLEPWCDWYCPSCRSNTFYRKKPQDILMQQLKKYNEVHSEHFA